MVKSKKLVYYFSDFLVLNLAFILTYYIVFDSSNYLSSQEFSIITILFNWIWVCSRFYSNQKFKKYNGINLKEEIKNLIPQHIFYMLSFYILTVSFFQNEGNTLYFFYGVLLVLCLFLTGRVLYKYVISKITKYKTLNYIAIGHCDALSKIEKTINEEHHGKVNFLGAWDNSTLPHKNYLGTFDELDAFLKSNNINLILYVSNTLPPSVLRKLMHYAKQNFIEFKIIPLEVDILTEGSKLELQEGFFVSARDEYVSHSDDSVFKRTFDIIFSLFVITFILSWLFPLICLLIVLESKGSPIFIQDRVGLRGRVFGCIKFRSMSVRENGNEVIQAQKHDSRVTKVGAFLRKSNLDEMPQFFNVLIGDMSIVGPRPHPVSLDVNFKKSTEDYSLRHYTKPGITGWAQVNGFRGPTDTQLKISTRTQCDLWYIRNRSFWLDVKIVFLTVFSSKVRQNAF